MRLLLFPSVCNAVLALLLVVVLVLPPAGAGRAGMWDIVTGIPGAIAATSLIFGMVHFSREGLLPLLLLGCVFGAAYASTRNLLAPIALHSLWNVCLLVQLLRAGGGM